MPESPQETPAFGPLLNCRSPLLFRVQGPVRRLVPCSPATTITTSTNELPQSSRDSAMQPLPSMEEEGV
ncbi:hypothetical protein VTJ49DRAFT_6626 [Mycothermus thermophilus]|uniref:Uncharacterized protein n=1 Tax=Humicola insolens TaxID=85995 RepID=A0ABR3V124_HUMIN